MQLVCICIKQKRDTNVRILAIERKEETMEDIVNQNSLNQTHLCRRCGRKLRNSVSKERGMGETCYNKCLAESRRKKLFSSSSLQTSRKNV